MHSTPVDPQRNVLMLGTFGLRPKATLRYRALAVARTLSSNDWSFRLMTTPWDHPADSGKRQVIDDIPVTNTRASHPIAFPLASGEMIWSGHRSRSDLIHVFKPKGFGDIAARWLRHGSPVVVDMDDWEGDGGWNEIGGYGSLQRHIFNWQERTWPRQADALTVASRELERRALTLGAPPDRVHYVPNGLTRDRFEELATANTIRAESREARNPLSATPWILLYTRFIEFDPIIVVRVLSAIREAFPNTKLLVVGASANGAAEVAVRAAAGQAGLSDCIRWHGWADPTEVAALAASCDVAIHPFDDNNVNRAKCSVKLLELLATGIPVVTTRVGENASFVVDEVSGLLSPPGEPTAIARSVIQLLRDPSLGYRIGKAAQERVSTEFLWDQLAPRVANAYVRALEARKAKAR
ncbi:MAG TPA: glycosyltransferase family 4 protein [Nitrolancea sp.]|nr:glycosyltransferase family 4 protein [Nitrolancea sp.]